MKFPVLGKRPVRFLKLTFWIILISSLAVSGIVALSLREPTPTALDLPKLDDVEPTAEMKRNLEGRGYPSGIHRIITIQLPPDHLPYGDCRLTVYEYSPPSSGLRPSPPDVAKSWTPGLPVGVVDDINYMVPPRLRLDPKSPRGRFLHSWGPTAKAPIFIMNTETHVLYELLLFDQ